MLGLIGLLPLWGKAVAILAIVAALTGTYAVWHHKIYTKGYDAAIAEVEAANTEGVNNAVEHVKKRRDCTGTWNQSRGVCE